MSDLMTERHDPGELYLEALRELRADDQVIQAAEKAIATEQELEKSSNNGTSK